MLVSAACAALKNVKHFKLASILLAFSSALQAKEHSDFQTHLVERMKHFWKEVKDWFAFLNLKIYKSMQLFFKKMRTLLQVIPQQSNSCCRNKVPVFPDLHF